jgi:hypothetical protein
LIVRTRLILKEDRVGFVDRLSRFARGPSETAGPRSTSLRAGSPLRYPDFPPSLAALAAPRCRKSGSAPVRMTKLRAVAHLGIRGGRWTDSKKLIWRRVDLNRLNHLEAPIPPAPKNGCGFLCHGFLSALRKSSTASMVKGPLHSRTTCPHPGMMANSPSGNRR